MDMAPADMVVREAEQDFDPKFVLKRMYVFRNDGLSQKFLNRKVLKLVRCFFHNCFMIAFN